jgi:hypothetical protein
MYIRLFNRRGERERLDVFSIEPKGSREELFSSWSWKRGYSIMLDEEGEKYADGQALIGFTDDVPRQRLDRINGLNDETEEHLIPDCARLNIGPPIEIEVEKFSRQLLIVCQFLHQRRDSVTLLEPLVATERRQIHNGLVICRDSEDELINLLSLRRLRATCRLHCGPFGLRLIGLLRGCH